MGYIYNNEDFFATEGSVLMLWKFARRCLFVGLAVVLVLTSCEGDGFAKADDKFSGAVSGYGGKSIIYKSSSGMDAPRELTVLFGRDGNAPDELSLIDYALVWLSERSLGGDATVFHAINATDTSSIVKMCERRARTLRYSAGIKAEIYVSGHFVVFVNCSGEYAGIKEDLVREFELE